MLVGELKLKGSTSLNATMIQKRIMTFLGHFWKISLNSSTTSMAILPYKLISSTLENIKLITLYPLVCSLFFRVLFYHVDKTLGVFLAHLLTAA